MTNYDDMPDWLKTDEDADELERQRQEKIKSDIDKIIPTEEQIVQLLEAAQSLNEQIDQINPDVIIFTGRSSALSETLYKATATRQRPIMRMSSAITPYFYGLAEDDSLITESGEQLQRECPDLRLDQSIMIVDDYAGSGSKSDKFLASMKKLGFQNTHFGVFLSQEDRAGYNPNLLIGSESESLKCNYSQFNHDF